MGKKQSAFLCRETDLTDKDFKENREFLANLQTSLLFALLEQNYITRYQFDLCTEEIRKL